jgi:PAS domain S-box-containing protein
MTTPSPPSFSLPYSLIETLSLRFPNLAIGIIGTNLEGTVTIWNEYATALYGWEPDEAIGRAIEDLTVGPVQQEQAAEIMEHLREGEPWLGTFVSRRKDGEYITINIANTLLVDDQGTPCGIAGLSREDAGQLSTSLAELMQLRELATRMDEVRFETAREIAGQFHDKFSQYLHLIKAERMEILNDPSLSPELKVRHERIDQLQEDLEEAMQGAWRALRPPLLDEFGIVAALEQLANASQQFELKEISTDIDEDLLSIDSELGEIIVMIVQEALTNVQLHAHATRCSVTVTVDGDLVSIDVTDNGVGVSSPYGFGLRLMQERVRRFGGVLELIPGPNGGTSLVVQLPYRARVQS